MPFPLADVKRAYGRSGRAGGPPDVRPYLLVGRELETQRRRLRAVLEWHARHEGCRRAEADFDDLAQAAGDYRLARCLAACLQGSFRFAPEPFEAAVAALDGPSRMRALRLAEAGVRGPSDLRLRLFAAVAKHDGGFATPTRRPVALAATAAELGIAPQDLEALLWLDAEGNQRLTAVGPPPTVQALAATYNRRALATLLVRALSADLILPEPDGADVRRLYFLVKRNGLLCDLQLVDPPAGAAGGVHVHLSGPLEVFGPRTRHGDRFASVLLSLLFRFPDLEGLARLLLNEREYNLVLGPDVADALGGDDPLGDAEPAGTPPTPAGGERGGEDVWGLTAPPAEPPPTAVVARPEVAGAFDSDVEAQLFATLRGMVRRGDAAGWVAEREPEPLIVGSTVMVPDFALSRPPSRGRPARRVFVEVIGFWTPAYRERKRDKLRQLAGRAELVLVVQEALAGHFEDLPFPVLTYRHRVSAAELIRLLSRTYAGPAEDAVAVREELDALLEAVDPALGLLGVEELCRALDLPTASALAGALGPPGSPREGAPVRPGGPGGNGLPGGWHWLPGVGVYHEAWLAALRERCAAAVAAGGGSVALEAVREAVQGSGLAGAAGAAAHLEVLLGPAGYEVSWQSLFEATVRPRAET